MLIQVENKIKELKALKSKQYYKQKDADLQNWGIAKEGKGKKATPIVITDEEYENLIKVYNGVGKTGRNTVAIGLRKAATIAMVVCVVAAVTALFTSASKGFVWASLWIMAGFAFSTLFKGIAEAIRLLQQILDGGKDGIPEKEDETAPAAPVMAAAPVMPGYYPVQPPIYQANYAQPIPQPYYTPAPPITTAPVAPVAPTAPVAPVAVKEEEKKADDYSSMPSYDFNPQDDFFTKPYEPKSTFGE